ncbi:MAG: TetR/AcrR family transcriptional regulator [Myxococcota bacterium]
MSQLGPDDWVRVASAGLAEGGVDKIRVEALARTLGVSKGSFYWHFRDRRSLLDSILARWEREATSNIIERVEALSGSPAERLKALMDITFRTPLEADRFEAALRAWAAGDERAQAAVRKVDRRRIGYVEGLLEEAGVPPAQAAHRAHLLYRTLVGEFVMRSSGEKASSARALGELRKLMLAGTGGGE